MRTARIVHSVGSLRIDSDLVGNVEYLGRRHLHTKRQLERLDSCRQVTFRLRTAGGV